MTELGPIKHHCTGIRSWVVSVAGLFGLLLSQGWAATPLSIPEREALIQAYAPLIKFDLREKYFPSSVDWYLERTAVMHKDWRRRSVQVRSLKSSQLSEYNDPGFYLTPFGTSDERLETYAGEPRIGQFVNSTCYATVSETDTEIQIQYLFFYPYNGRQLQVFDLVHSCSGANLGAHEGDWEHLDVHLMTKPSSFTPNRITQIYYSRHTPAFGKTIVGKNVEFFEGTHPVVYAARNGHASYPHRIWGISWLFDQANGLGFQWRCWENVIDVGSKSSPSARQEWIQFPGAWGNNDSPAVTPSFQSWWKE